MTVIDAPETTSSEQRPGSDAPSRRKSLPIVATRTRMLLTTVAAALISAIAVLTWMLIDSRDELQDRARTAADTARAEQVALDYAVGAASMNYQDLSSWKTALVAGTTPDISNKLTEAASAMEQIVVPLQWISTPTALTAKATATPDGTYTVDAFVSVLTTNTQSPDGLQSTAAYRITLDSDWSIKDVGGIAGVVGEK